MPKFRDSTAWQQAETLMQPAFIRLIDNLRKHLEISTWQGRYVDVPLFPEGTSDQVKIQVQQLQAELATANRERAEEIEWALAGLPVPFPGYQLHLTQAGQEVVVDIWDLCYQICFQDFPAASNLDAAKAMSDREVEVDPTLLEGDDVNWQRLDEKASQVVEQLFANLKLEI